VWPLLTPQCRPSAASELGSAIPIIAQQASLPKSPNCVNDSMSQSQPKSYAPFSKAELMQVMARACGHNHLNQFEVNDPASWKRNIAKLAGIEYSGFDPER
jgi:hypothetical protein